uniref:WD_REPEATS_REGION domain-containing protein n=1 Tax=Macrostomum lignano TaxID=282301 RepID=A0A1I8F9Y9_9PLAT
PCPRHNVPAKPLVVNLALCDQVGDLLIRCRYASPGQTGPNAESSRLRINISIVSGARVRLRRQWHFLFSVCVGARQRMEKQIRHLEEQLEQRTAESERLRVSMLSGVVERLDRLDRHVTDRYSCWRSTKLSIRTSWRTRWPNKIGYKRTIVVIVIEARSGAYCGGDYLYSASGDKSSENVAVLSLALTGSVLFSGSQDNTIRVWDVAPASAEFRYLLEDASKVTQTASAPCASRSALFILGSFTLVKVWDLASRICLRTLTGFVRWVRALWWSANSCCYVGCGNSVLVIDLCNFSTVRSLCTDEEGNNVHSVLFLPDFVIAGHWLRLFLLVWEALEEPVVLLLLSPLQLLLGSASAIAAVETDVESTLVR